MEEQNEKIGVIKTRKMTIELLDDSDSIKVHKTFLKYLNDNLYKLSNEIVSIYRFNNDYKIRLANLDEFSKPELVIIFKKIEQLRLKLAATNIHSVEGKKINLEIKSLEKDINVIYSRFDQKEQLLKQDKTDENCTYRHISSYYINTIPSYIFSALNHSVHQDLKKIRFDIINGILSYPTYKKNSPIPFMKSAIKNIKAENGIYTFDWVKNPLTETIIKFKINFGKDSSNNKIIIDRILEGTYGYGDASIQINKDEIYLLLPVKFDVDKNKKIDPEIIVGVDLGKVNIVSCALNKGHATLNIGGQEFKKKIESLSEKNKKLNKDLILATGGRGRNKKLKCSYENKRRIKNFTNTFNHNIAKVVVDFAIKNNAGIIRLEELAGIKKNKLYLNDWTYFDIQTKITNKAYEHGIVVEKVKPAYTSTTCHVCLKTDLTQRHSQSDFVCSNEQCKQYQKTINADKNAAINIANNIGIMKLETGKDIKRKKSVKTIKE